MCMYVCGEVCEEPWHVGTHVDSAIASQTLPIPNHSHTQAITSREDPLQDRQGAVHISSSHSVKNQGPPREGDPEAGDKVRKRHPHTHTPTVRVCLDPTTGPPTNSLVGKAALRGSAAPEQHREAGRAGSRVEIWERRVARWHRAGGLSLFKSRLLPFTPAGAVEHPPLFGPQYPCL